MQELLKIEDLKTHFSTHDGTVKAVDGVSLQINRGETLGIVGESGCGKSVTALSIMRLIADPPGKIVGGKILFEGQNLLDLGEKQMRDIRGKKISMIFQEPMTSLDPVFTIGHEIIETLQIHQDLDKREARRQTIDILTTVGIPDADKRVDSYPHELSGGMRQRAMIAMALACNPVLLIADEPTTALDVTIQAQILRLINELKEKFDTSVLLITHDLGVIAEMAEHVAVMYCGHIIEYADVHTLFENPLHPYTKGLYRSIPRLDVEVKRLDAISGMVPNPIDLSLGCPYQNRCEFCSDTCLGDMPALIPVADQHLVKCHLNRGS